MCFALLVSQLIPKMTRSEMFVIKPSSKRIVSILRTDPLRTDPVKILWVSFLGCCSIATCQPSDKERPDDSATFEKLKVYLSHSPSVGEIRFQKTVVSRTDRSPPWQTNQTFYVGAYQEESFFLEERDPRNLDGIPYRAVGRANSLFWHFQNGELMKWEKNPNEKENVLVALVGVAEVELLTAANAGIPLIVNKSVKWSGANFEAEMDERVFRRDVPPENARTRIFGECTVSPIAGLTSLKIRRDGAAQPLVLNYERHESTSIPSYFPSVVRQETRDAQGLLAGIIERDVQLLRLSTSNTTIAFGPERITRLIPSLRASLVYSNNVLFKEKKGVLQEVEQHKPAGQTHARSYVLGMLLLSLVVFPVAWWLYKRPGQ